LISWGIDPATGEPWYDGPPHPVGDGAHAGGDGLNAVQHYACGSARVPPAEIYETKTQFFIVKEELATDSGGAGKYRGGVGIDKVFESRHDSTYTTPVVEGTKSTPWGFEGGTDGRANACNILLPDGTKIRSAKGTAFHLPKGAKLVLGTGGGGGFGPPAERDVESVMDDVRDGYISEEFARKHYPHAFVATSDVDAPVPG
jgi:N-methylhydantoinase B